MTMTRKQAIEKIEQYLSEIDGFPQENYKIDEFRSDIPCKITIANPKDQHIAEFEIPGEDKDNNYNPGGVVFIDIVDSFRDIDTFDMHFECDTWEEFAESMISRINWFFTEYAGLMTAAYVMLRDADLNLEKVEYHGHSSQLVVTGHDGGIIAFSVIQVFDEDYRLEVIINDDHNDSVKMNFYCFIDDLDHKIVKMSKDFLAKDVKQESDKAQSIIESALLGYDLNHKSLAHNITKLLKANNLLT